MVFEKICSPALIYIIFSLTQIVIDTFNGLYNTALMKAWVAIIFTILLNYLCSIGLGVISWFIVFIPFILMSLIITILLLVFGLDPSTGKTLINMDNNDVRRKHDRHDKQNGNYYPSVVNSGNGSMFQDLSQYLQTTTSDIENKASTYGQDISQFIQNSANQINNDINGSTTAQPTTAQPSTTQPTTAQSSTAQPTTAQPSTAQPSSQLLSTTKQPFTQLFS
jgi:predicted membrane protein